MTVLMRSFSRREKVMLVILALVLIVGLYILFVHRPTQDKLEALAVEKDELELQEQVATVRLAQYTAMKAELDEIFALPQDQITVMPEYDNAEALMVQFNSIFMGLEPRLSFPQVQFANGVATRPIHFEFEAPSYDQARAILTRLTRTGNRSLLDGLSIVPMSGSAQSGSAQSGSIQTDAVRVQGSISFYELASDQPQNTGS